MGKEGFKNLEVWKKSKDLAVNIYSVTNSPQFNSDYGLRDQIRRAAVSIPSNIAEGDERYTNEESIRFLFIAKGSLAELITQLEISKEIGYLEVTKYESIIEDCKQIGRMLGGLIKSRISL